MIGQMLMSSQPGMKSLQAFASHEPFKPSHVSEQLELFSHARIECLDNARDSVFPMKCCNDDMEHPTDAGARQKMGVGLDFDLSNKHFPEEQLESLHGVH